MPVPLLTKSNVIFVGLGKLRLTATLGEHHVRLELFLVRLDLHVRLFSMLHDLPPRHPPPLDLYHLAAQALA